MLEQSLFEGPLALVQGPLTPDRVASHASLLLQTLTALSECQTGLALVPCAVDLQRLAVEFACQTGPALAVCVARLQKPVVGSAFQIALALVACAARLQRLVVGFEFQIVLEPALFVVHSQRLLAPAARHSETDHWHRSIDTNGCHGTVAIRILATCWSGHCRVGT